MILADEQAELGGSLLAERAPPSTAARRRTGLARRCRRARGAVAEVRCCRAPRRSATTTTTILGLRRAGDRPSAAPRPRRCRASGSGRCAPSRWCSPPARSSGRWCFADNDRPGHHAGRRGAHLPQPLRRRWPAAARSLMHQQRRRLSRRRSTCSAPALEVAAVVDLRADADGGLPARRRARPASRCCRPVRSSAPSGRRRVAAARSQASMRPATRDGAASDVACDLLLMSGGWNPAVHLFSQSRGKLATTRTHRRLRARRHRCRPSARPAPATAPSASPPASRDGCAGRAEAAAARRLRGAAAPDTPGGRGTGRARRWRGSGCRTAPAGRGAKPFVDFQNDVTAKDIALAVREGYRSVEHVKRYTTTGMGTDQGKTRNLNAPGDRRRRAGPADPGGRHHHLPPALHAGDLRRARRRATRRPVRADAHARRCTTGTRRTARVFEDVGQWKRPWYFPQPARTWHAGGRRASAARCATRVGILDASTLGKIDIQGPDARELPRPRLHQRLGQARGRAAAATA